MMEMQATKCKNCGQFVVFMRTRKGKKMPCNERKVPYLSDENGPDKVFTIDGRLVSCYLNVPIEECTSFGYVPHWGSCVPKHVRERLDAYKNGGQKTTPPVKPKTDDKAPTEKKWDTEQESLFILDKHEYGDYPSPPR